MSVEFDPRTGTLIAGEAVRDALLRQVSGAAVDDPDSRNALAELRAAGALAGTGRAHPALDPALDALRHPDWCTLSLSYAGKALHGWVSAATAALLMPADDDGRRKLLRVHPSLLPEALARAAGLSPRPRSSHTIRLDDLPDAVTVTRRWRLSVAWSATDGGRHGRMLEVVDTASGLFTVEPGSTPADRLAVPATPTWIWRVLVCLIARTRLDGLQPLPPDSDVPSVDNAPRSLQTEMQPEVSEHMNAYDQWGGDPGRAAGAAAFNIASMVGTNDDTGGAVSTSEAVSVARNAVIHGTETIARLPTVADVIAGAARRLPGFHLPEPDSTRIRIPHHVDHRPGLRRC